MACEACRRRSALYCGVELPQGRESVPTALCRHQPDYPQALTQLDDPPAVLYATCTIERLRELLAKPTVAIVGERQHSRYAQQITFAIARELAAAGVTIISGLHRGLDGIAHQGALDAKGQSIAVMPCALEGSPQTRGDLYQRIGERGAALSELPPGFHPTPHWCFMARQRITAALASVVVVVEAKEQSIVLLTAEIARELGHPVGVLPGRVNDSGGIGTFSLLREGAHPVGHAQDVLDILPMIHTTEHRAQRLAA